MEKILRLGIDSRPAREGARQYRVATEEVTAASRRMAAAQTEVNGNFHIVHQNFTKTAEAARVATINKRQLANALQGLAIQATGANTHLFKLGQILSGFAVSGGVMIGVLGGIAALGFAWEKATAATRKHREEIETLIARYKEAATARARAGVMGPGMDVVSAMQEREQLRQQYGQGYHAGDIADDPGKLGQRFRALGVVIQEASAQIVEARAEEARAAAATAAAIARQAEQMRDAALAAAQLQVELGLLTFQTRDLTARLPSTAELLGGTAYGSYADVEGGRRRFDVVDPVTGQRRPQPNFGTEAIVRPPPLWQIRHRTTQDPPPPTDWSKWAGAAQIGGGILLGTGLAGNGYAAAGLSGGMSLAAQGAMLGSVVPGIGTAVGAVVGAVGGMVSGLIGHSKKAREEAEAQRQAQRQLNLSIEARRAELAGDKDRVAAIQLVAQQEQQLAEARKAGMSKASIAAMEQLAIEERLALARKQEAEDLEKYLQILERRRSSTEDLGTRGLRAVGLNDQADYASMIFSQRREKAEARKAVDDEGNPIYSANDLAFMDMVHGLEQMGLELEQWRRGQVDAIQAAADRQLGALADQIELQEAQLRVNEDQLRIAEQNVAQLQRVADSLAAYGQSLLVGPHSPLSPFSQLQEARSQFDLMKNMALGGDLSAAQSLPGAGRTLLDASRAYNASGPGYVSDFEAVRRGVADVQGHIGAQKTIEELMFRELQMQTQKQEQQIREAQAQQEAIRDAAATQIAVINANAANTLAVAAQQLIAALDSIEALRDIGDKLNPPTSGGSDAESAGREGQNFFDWLREHYDLGADGNWYPKGSGGGGGGGGGGNPPASQAFVAELQSGFSSVVVKLDQLTVETRGLRAAVLAE